MKIALIKYNAGNVVSVRNALNRLGIEPIWTDDHDEIRAADKVIFPGVGHINTAMASAKEKGLDVLIPSLKQPVLGICVGLQLMCKHSEEGDTPCVGIFDTQVRKFEAQSQKVPQMGWNTLQDLKSPLFANLPTLPYVYYVHSYYAEYGDTTIATTDYGVSFSAALHRDNFYAVQFHPEKSGDIGSRILQNFLEL